MLERKTLSIKSPAGEEDAIFIWAESSTHDAEDKDENAQIIDTIKWIVNDIQELVKDLDILTVFRNLDRTSYSSVRTLCEVYNQKITILRKKWRSCYPDFLTRQASPNHLKHILQQCYNRAVESPDLLNQYQPFSPEVYGETSFELVTQMIHTVHLEPEDVFVDLGSGVGQVILQVAAATSVGRCLGIEKADTPALYAHNLDRQFKQWMAFYGKPFRPYSLIKGDFLDEENRIKIESANVIFVNNFAFGPHVDHQLKLRFRDLKDGVVIISSKSFCALNFRITERNLGDIGAIMHVTPLAALQGAVSWTPKPFTYFVHRIDRSLLEFYFAKLKDPSLKSPENSVRRDRQGRIMDLKDSHRRDCSAHFNEEETTVDSSTQSRLCRQSSRLGCIEDYPMSSSCQSVDNSSNQTRHQLNSGLSSPPPNARVLKLRRDEAKRPRITRSLSNSSRPLKPSKKKSNSRHKHLLQLEGLHLLHRSTLEVTTRRHNNEDNHVGSEQGSPRVNLYRSGGAKETLVDFQDVCCGDLDEETSPAIVNYCEVVKHRLMRHLQTMRLPSYRSRVSSGVTLEEDRNRKLQGLVSQLEREIVHLEEEGVQLLETMRKGLGVNVRKSKDQTGSKKSLKSRKEHNNRQIEALLSEVARLRGENRYLSKELNKTSKLDGARSILMRKSRRAASSCSWSLSHQLSKTANRRYRHLTGFSWQEFLSHPLSNKMAAPVNEEVLVVMPVLPAATPPPPPLPGASSSSTHILPRHSTSPPIRLASAAQSGKKEFVRCWVEHTVHQQHNSEHDETITSPQQYYQNRPSSVSTASVGLLPPVLSPEQTLPPTLLDSTLTKCDQCEQSGGGPHTPSASPPTLGPVTPPGSPSPPPILEAQPQASRGTNVEKQLELMATYYRLTQVLTEVTGPPPVSTNKPALSNASTISSMKARRRSRSRCPSRSSQSSVSRQPSSSSPKSIKRIRLDSTVQAAHQPSQSLTRLSDPSVSKQAMPNPPLPPPPAAERSSDVPPPPPPPVATIIPAPPWETAPIQSPSLSQRLPSSSVYDFPPPPPPPPLSPRCFLSPPQQLAFSQPSTQSQNSYYTASLPTRTITSDNTLQTPQHHFYSTSLTTSQISSPSQSHAHFYPVPSNSASTYNPSHTFYNRPTTPIQTSVYSTSTPFINSSNIIPSQPSTMYDNTILPTNAAKSSSRSISNALSDNYNSQSQASLHYSVRTSLATNHINRHPLPTNISNRPSLATGNTNRSPQISGNIIRPPPVSVHSNRPTISTGQSNRHSAAIGQSNRPPITSNRGNRPTVATGHNNPYTLTTGHNNRHPMATGHGIRPLNNSGNLFHQNQTPDLTSSSLQLPIVETPLVSNHANYISPPIQNTCYPGSVSNAPSNRPRASYRQSRPSYPNYDSYLNEPGNSSHVGHPYGTSHRNFTPQNSQQTPYSPQIRPTRPPLRHQQMGTPDSNYGSQNVIFRHPRPTPRYFM